MQTIWHAIPAPVYLSTTCWPPPPTTTTTPHPAAVTCGYTKCGCDSACPIVQGVSLGYMLQRLT